MRTDGQPPLPESLRKRVSDDLARPGAAPVVASRLQSRLSAIFLGALLLVAVALAGGSTLPGPWILAPLAAAAAGLALGSLALGREAIPGRGPALGLWLASAAAGAVAFLLYAVLLDRASPGASGVLGPTELVCCVTGVSIAIPPFVLGTLVLRAGWVVRPALAGAMLGITSALVGLAGLHLHCPDCGLAHVGLFHGAVIVVLGALGAVIGRRMLSTRR